jgi:hypothetical protein
LFCFVAFLQQAYFYCLKVNKESGTILLLPTSFKNKTATPGGLPFSGVGGGT